MRIHGTTITRFNNLNGVSFTKQSLKKGNTVVYKPLPVTLTPLSYRDTLLVSHSNNSDSIFKLHLKQ